MPAIARHDDPCGGKIIATATKTTVNGLAVARVGDAITPHGDSAHNSAVMVEGSSTVTVEGKAVCRVGDAASCGHAITEGSPDVTAG